MSQCYNKLTASIALNCSVNLVSGIADKVYLINREDVDFDQCTYNSLNDNIIETLVLKSASPDYKGFYVQGFRNSNDYENMLVKGKYMNGWDQKITVRIFDNAANTKERVNEISNGKFIAIIENNYQSTDGTSTFEVCGWNVGLEALEITRNVQDADTKGAWTVILQTDEDNKEPYPAKTLYKTSIAATRAALEALLS